VIAAAATNTRIRGNVAVGNPGIQVSVAVQGTAGVDIWDLSAPGATVYDRNVCMTGINAPCSGVSNPSAVPRKPGI
jgi:hypothetical protein